MAYRALVCLYLYGGRDHHNTVVPYDQATYDLYSAQRPNFDFNPRATLTPTLLAPSVPLPAGRQYALAPALAKLKPIFDAGDLAVVLNVGVMREPTTKAQYLAQSVELPPNLFAHNFQQIQAQSLSPAQAASGWGGRLGDKVAILNTNQALTCINAAGNDVFLTGETIPQYGCLPSGPQALGSSANELTFGSARAKTALRAIMRGNVPNLIANQNAVVAGRSFDNYGILKTCIDAAPAISDRGNDPVHDALVAQMRLVLQMVATASLRGAEREIFFVTQGGYDLHSNMLGLDGLHTAYANAIDYLYYGAIELGVQDKLVLFDQTDFGRTGLQNEDGTDHGWGGNSLVIGAPVAGGRIYGTPPSLAAGGPDDLGQQRMLPSNPWEVIAEPLAEWMGATVPERATILPYRVRFPQANLPVIAPAATVPSSFAIGNAASANEGNSGTTNFTFVVTRTGGLDRAASVSWAVTGNGANPASAADFVGGAFPAGTANFAINAATANVVVPVQGDVAIETNEAFAVTLSNPSAGDVIGTATATSTIINDDNAPAFEAETTALFAAYTVQPTTGYKSAVDNLIKKMKANGVWAALGRFHFTTKTAGVNNADVVRDWKGGTALARIGNPVIDNLNGFIGGDPANYLALTGGLGAVPGYTLNSNAAFIWMANSNLGGGHAGMTPGSGALDLLVGWKDNGVIIRNGEGNNGAGVQIENGTLLGMVRRNANDFDIYGLNGAGAAAKATVNQASSVIDTRDQTLLTTGIAPSMKIFFAGAQLTDAQVTALRGDIATLFVEAAL
jgi:uncharacterized protein (DUF1501 family)